MGDKKIYGSPAIGERLKDLLEEWEETQDSLAQKISNETGEKVSRATVAKWISGDRDIPASDLVAICKCYNVSANYLLFGVGHTLSIDPDVTAAVKYTGLSEESLFLIAEITKNTYPHFEWNGNISIKTEYDNAPLIDKFIMYGMEKILNELQDYSNIVIEAENYIKNAENYLNSPYSEPTASLSLAYNGQSIVKRLRFQSLSLGEAAREAGDNVFRLDQIMDDLKKTVKELQDYEMHQLQQKPEEKNNDL